MNRMRSESGQTSLPNISIFILRIWNLACSIVMDQVHNLDVHLKEAFIYFFKFHNPPPPVPAFVSHLWVEQLTHEKYKKNKIN